jgi:hypothetical protein
VLQLGRGISMQIFSNGGPLWTNLAGGQSGE